MPQGALADLETAKPRPSTRPAVRPLRRAAMIGNFPPRMCGIATFTRDLLEGLSGAAPELDWQVVALSDRSQGYAFDRRVTHIIRQNEMQDYVATADALNRLGVEAVFLQHEFGIFGGPAGEFVLELVKRLRMPVIVTLHTVLAQPDEAQRRVMDGLVQHAASLVVMAKRGADMLASVYGAARGKIRVIPHGAPTRGLTPSLPFKERLGLSDYKTLLTFGLLSPNKGIETIVRALPAILNRAPEATYVVAGATHPHLLEREGEKYRDSLVTLADSLGVADRLVFINRYLGDEELIDILQAADVYVTPYLTEAQITSGTLSYAIALGRPVVSTPYWHAQEALADGVGLLCPFGDSNCFADRITGLLTDEKMRAGLSRRAFLAGRASQWPQVGAAYVDIAQRAVAMKASLA